jgi:hypothetical protein
MNDPGPRDIDAALVDPSMEVCVAMAALHLAGANKFDPVGLRYLNVLAERASAHEGPVRRILDGKLAHAVVAFSERFEQAQRDAQAALDQIAQNDLLASADLQHLLKTGDVKSVRQRIAILNASGRPAPLGKLARYIAQRTPEMQAVGFGAQAGLHAELEATQYFRNTWSKLSVAKRVTQAMGQAPKNAGPINSHMLVLRSLALMREISPDYLNQFTSYVDALLWLDQFDKDTRPGKPTPKKPMRQKTTKQ